MFIRPMRPLLIAALALTLAGCAGGQRGGYRNQPYDRPYGQGYNQSAQTLTCESEDGRGRSCRSDRRIARAEIDQRLSSAPCELGRTWGFSEDRVWVNNGCRARFRVYAKGNQGGGWGGGGGGWNSGNGQDSSVLRCESEDNRRRRCDAGFQTGRVVVERQLSSTRCEKGRSWGNDRQGVWVDQGCRADFRVYRR